MHAVFYLVWFYEILCQIKLCEFNLWKHYTLSIFRTLICNKYNHKVEQLNKFSDSFWRSIIKDNKLRKQFAVSRAWNGLCTSMSSRYIITCSYKDLASLDYYINKLQWELTVKFIFKDIFATLMWGSAALITNSLTKWLISGQISS